MRTILHVSQSWPAYYRQALRGGEDRENVTAARETLLSVFSANVRATEELPQQEQRQIIQLFESVLAEKGVVLLEDEDSPQPSSLRPQVPVAALLAVVIIGLVVSISGAIFGIAKFRVGGHPVPAPISRLTPVAMRRLPANVAAPRQHAIAILQQPSTPSAPTKQRSQKVHVAQGVSNPAVIRGIVASPKPQRAAASRDRRVIRTVAFLPAMHTIAPPRSFIPQPLPLQSLTPTPEVIVGNLYAQANPDANVLSVVIVHRSAATVIADVTSREDDATVVDRLTLAPRAHSFDVVATQRLTQDSQSARACFIRGAWRSC